MIFPNFLLRVVSALPRVFSPSLGAGSVVSSSGGASGRESHTMVKPQDLRALLGSLIPSAVCEEAETGLNGADNLCSPAALTALILLGFVASGLRSFLLLAVSPLAFVVRA